MSESQEHIDLVKIVFKQIQSMVPRDYRGIVEADCVEAKKPAKIIRGYIPDVFFWENNRLILGEAKTLDDFEKRHSKEQYKAYVEECGMFQGQATLVIGVPWQLVASAKNNFRLLRNKNNYEFEIIVINQLGRCYIV